MRGLFAAIAALAASASAQNDALDAYMRNLAIEGNVTTENGRISDRGIDANTRFEIAVQAQWGFQVSVIKRGMKLELTIEPDFRKLDVSVRHRLRLPDGENVDSRRYRTLLLHEYDHVAISTDERPRILLREMIRGIRSISVPWQGTVPPPDADVNALIAAEVEKCKAAVVELIESAYVMLDASSDHGRKPLPSRLQFFSSLYGPDHLKEAKSLKGYPVEKIAASAEYRTAMRYYR